MGKAVIFDIDGVLVDSFESSLRYFQDLMRKYGYEPPTRESYRKVFSMPGRQAIAYLTGLAGDEVEEILQDVRKKILPYPDELIKAPDGLEDVLRALSRSYKLGIVTSRVRQSVYSMPQLAAVEPYFQVAISYDDVDEHKPNPEPLLKALDRLDVNPADAVYIGDAETDVQAARSAGTYIIGFGDAELPGVDAQTSDFQEIPRLAKDLLG